MISFVKSFGIRSPLIYFVDHTHASITMQMIYGTLVRDLPESKLVDVSEVMGSMVGVMHKNGMMHGDLTTSNLSIWKHLTYRILAVHNTIKSEDHAVDLRLIKEILNSAHAQVMKPAWNNFLVGYESVMGQSNSAIIVRLVSDIEGRGRYARVV